MHVLAVIYLIATKPNKIVRCSFYFEFSESILDFKFDFTIYKCILRNIARPVDITFKPQLFASMAFVGIEYYIFINIKRHKYKIPTHVKLKTR